MRERLSKIFHFYTKRLIGKNGIPENFSEWPEEWSTVFFKSYPRLEQIKLPPPLPTNQQLEKVLAARFSEEKYRNSSPLTLSELSTLLHFSAGIRPSAKSSRSFRFYPSGGARYPLEIYLAQSGSDELSAGIYHYQVATHSLERLAGGNDFEKIKETLTYPFAKSVPTYLIVTSVWERTFNKYKDFGYPVVLAEAGHLSQNILLLATALGLKNRAYVGFKFDPLADLLDLDITEEAPINMVLLGR